MYNYPKEIASYLAMTGGELSLIIHPKIFNKTLNLASYKYDYPACIHSQKHLVYLVNGLLNFKWRLIYSASCARS